MNGLEILILNHSRDALLGQILAVAPNLKELVLRRPFDEKFDLKQHSPQLRMVRLEKHKRIELKNMRFKEQIEVMDEGELTT